MVLNHVAQGACVFVVSPAALNPDGLGVGYLNVIDVLPVPERLEDAVGKTKDQQVLYCLFAEIMIDAMI